VYVCMCLYVCLCVCVIGWRCEVVHRGAGMVLCMSVCMSVCVCVIGWRREVVHRGQGRPSTTSSWSKPTADVYYYSPTNIKFVRALISC